MTNTRTPVEVWTENITARIADRAACPICFTTPLIGGICRRCGADFSGASGHEAWASSTKAIEALRDRAAFLNGVAAVSHAPAPLPVTGSQLPIPGGAPSLPVAGFAPAGPPPTARGYIAPSRPPAHPGTLMPRPTASANSSASLQSVLAVAGAGLFAVAAVVFTFFNADLADKPLRVLILSVIAALFLGATTFLARKRLTFSAEAVGALGMVFVALAVSALAALAPGQSQGWTVAAVGTLVSGAAMVALAVIVRVRSWLWIALIGLSLVPWMFGLGADNQWALLVCTFGSAVAASVLIAVVPRFAPRFGGSRFVADRTALTVVQAVMSVATPAVAVFVPITSAFPPAMQLVSIAIAAVSVLSLLSARHIMGFVWTFLSGLGLTSAALGMTFDLPLTNEGMVIAVACSAAISLVVFGSILPVPRGVDRGLKLTGVGVGLAAPALMSLNVVLIVALRAVSSPWESPFSGFGTTDSATLSAIPLALAIGAGGIGLFSYLEKKRSPQLATVASSVGVAYAVAAALTFACSPAWNAFGAVMAALVLAAMLVFIVRFPAFGGRMSPAPRVILTIGAHLAVLLALILSWTSIELGALTGLAVLAGIAAVAYTVPAGARFVHVGAGYAYALIVFAVALDLAGVGDVARLSLTSALGSLGAVAAIFLRRIPERAMLAVLVVTAIPYLVGVAQVFFERSGWTALATGCMFVLTLTLVLTRGRRINAVVRAASAGLLVPTLAVLVVCLTAQLPASGSPVALPIVAVIVSLTLASGLMIERSLEQHHLTAAQARLVRISIEASSLLTGVLTVALALWRQAAGLPTASLVLLILAVGAAGASLWARRRYGWWLAGAAATGALWCLWALIGLRDVEPYLLPPTLGAALIALILTSVRRPAPSLYGAGLALTIVPVLAVLAIAGTPEPSLAPWRAYGLLAASWVLTAWGVMLARPDRFGGRWATLRVPTLVLATVASVAAVVQATRWGVGLDSANTSAVPLVVLCLAIGAAGAIPALTCALALRRSSAPGSKLAHTRWIAAPALTILVASAWMGIHRDWPTIWIMWALLIALLTFMFVTALRMKRGATLLPPVWFTFTLAFVTAIVAWSPRDLRVEMFSLPLGLFLLAVGILFLGQLDTPHDPAAPTSGQAQRGTLDSWPGRWGGSWSILGPGLIVTVLASIVATFTDPLTWRAILVIAIALVAILWGAKAKLRAPFVLGVIVLPVENVFVFLVQFGRGIESMPWWITLAVVGAVLLILAVTYERREGEENTITARLRDLK